MRSVAVIAFSVCVGVAAFTSYRAWVSEAEFRAHFFDSHGSHHPDIARGNMSELYIASSKLEVPSAISAPSIDEGRPDTSLESAGYGNSPLFGDDPTDDPPYRFVNYDGGGELVTSEVGAYDSAEAATLYPKAKFGSSAIVLKSDLADFEREGIDPTPDLLSDIYPEVTYRSGPMSDPSLANDERPLDYPY